MTSPARCGFSFPLPPPSSHTALFSTPSDDNNNNDNTDALRIEQARRDILRSRRKNVRGMLRAAETSRNYRLQNFPPALDDDGNPIKDSADGGRTAVTYTAFAVAAGAIALRIGGRAALVSAVGLDFAKDNPELQQQLDQVLDAATNADPAQEAFLFILAWTIVKVLCFDAGGIVLALSAGLLFGGVFQGAFMSALGATIGSAICFGLAQLDSPVRKQALRVLEEYPSLRGIEKVVAKDGFKAILTLRLAPILPIPLGLYNYVYGVTNVPFLDFAAGIFLGSLKPYLLDSYLGYFGKTVIDGSAMADTGGQVNAEDVILLLAVGLSVLIGVFASQLATETWDTVLEEVKAEEKAKKEAEGEESDENDGVIRKFFGLEIPKWIVGFQLNLKMADERVNELIDVEFDAKVWNYTEPEEIPQETNPALKPNSPEVQGFMKGVDIGSDICDGLVLSPILFFSYLTISDPFFDEKKYVEERPDRTKFRSKYAQDKESAKQVMAGMQQVDIQKVADQLETESTLFGVSEVQFEKKDKEDLLQRVSNLKADAEQRLERLEALLDNADEQNRK